MALMPKRVKHRKSQRGRIKGSATRGNTVVFGDYGIQSLEPGWVKATTIEAGRIAASAIRPRRRKALHSNLPRQISFQHPVGDQDG